MDDLTESAGFNGLFSSSFSVLGGTFSILDLSKENKCDIV